ncbi:MAG: pyridoxamine 5'-phosphate oxidase family protein [Acidimicrobiales bacterium]
MNRNNAIAGRPYTATVRVAPATGRWTLCPDGRPHARCMGDGASPQILVEMDEDECWARLHEHRVGRLVVKVGSQPDIFPVNYLVDDHHIVVRTAEGTKLAAALMGQLVAFEIDHIDEHDRVGWSVVVHGTASESRTLPGDARPGTGGGAVGHR